MINVNELMIRNLIKFISTDSIEKVIDLNSHRKTPTINNVSIKDVEEIPLTEEWLVRFGFVKDNKGDFWINLQTHYLDLISSNGYFYPVYAEYGEFNNEPEQRVSLNRIK